jgi:hypothetical protein
MASIEWPKLTGAAITVSRGQSVVEGDAGNLGERLATRGVHSMEGNVKQAKSQKPSVAALIGGGLAAAVGMRWDAMPGSLFSGRQGSPY